MPTQAEYIHFLMIDFYHKSPLHQLSIENRRILSVAKGNPDILFNSSKATKQNFSFFDSIVFSKSAFEKNYKCFLQLYPVLLEIVVKKTGGHRTAPNLFLIHSSIE